MTPTPSKTSKVNPLLTLASSTCAGADAISNSSRASLSLSLSLSPHSPLRAWETLPQAGRDTDPSHRVSTTSIRNRSAAIAMASAETITFESHPGWTLQARFFRDVKNAEEVGNLIVAGKLPVKTSVINAKLVPGERELRRNRKEGRKAHERARVRYPLGPGVPQRARPAGRRRSRSRSCSQKQGAPPPLTRPQQWTDSWPRSFVGAGPQTCFRFTRRATRPSAPTSPRRD